jgi:membrane protein
LQTFSNTRASQAATSLAYYAIFSLFPLLLVLIAGGSYFMDDQLVYLNITRIVQRTLPVSPDLINNNLDEILDSRDAVGLISLLTLLWSASGFFTNLAYNINLAWSEAPRRNFLKKRLIGLGMIGGISGLLMLSLILDWVASLIPFLSSENASVRSLILWTWFSNLGSWLMIFLLFLTLYRWVPTIKVHWSAILWGAFTASILWRIAIAGFGLYVSSGLGRYQLVYGSLGAIVALLFLIFIVSLITLFGAHLTAAIDHWKKEEQIKTQKGVF